MASPAKGIPGGGEGRGMRALTWQVGYRVIPFQIGYDCAEPIAREVFALDPDILFVVADASAWRLHGERHESILNRYGRTRMIVWDGGEIDKTLRSVERIIQQAVA